MQLQQGFDPIVYSSTNSSWQKKQLVLQVPLFLLAGISTLNCTILYIHATQVAN